MAQPPQGQRFSHLYIAHPELLPDSIRARRRLGSLFFQYRTPDLLKIISRELGISTGNVNSINESSWSFYFEKAQLRDVLDTITIVFRNSGSRRSQFLEEVRRILREERVRYLLDDLGGVHFTVDTAFEQARVSTVSALGADRYLAVRQSLADAYAALDELPPNGKAAVRNVFFANESLFRLIFPDAHQLGIGELKKHLKPTLDRKYDQKIPAIYAAQKQFVQFASWVEGAHFYRHEPGSEEPTQPPLEMAIHYVTAGTTWLRWLQGFDEVC